MNFHADNVDSRYIVKTPYGSFHVCEDCLKAHFPVIHTQPHDPKKHPIHETRGCECEHSSHFDNGHNDLY